MPTPSLLIVPSRFKSGKLYSQIPTSGAGDFTVTRATSATRVNASGLIEVQKTNLAFHSTDWTNNWNAGASSGTTIVTNSALSLAPDATATANEIYPTSGNTNHVRASNSTTAVTYVSGTVYTQSAFFKAGIGVGIRVQLHNPAARFSQSGYANFDLSAGTVLVVSGTTADTNRAAQIENYGNGWYRCSYTATCTSAGTGVGVIATLIAASGDTRSPSFAGTVTDYILGWGAQLEEGSSASEYIPTTTVARTRFAGVTVDGTVATNIPRLDYLASDGTVGCPALLVEPSGTNLSLNSNSFSVETAPVATVVQNQVDIFGNPDSAWLMSGADSSTDAANANNVRRIISGFTSGSTYAGSIYIKSPTGVPVTFRYRQATVITSTVASGDAWFRAVNISTLSSTSYRAIFYTDDGAPIIMCHSQAELGTVPTSYIGPVAGTALTRNADVILVSGAVSGSIGQTEGTFYAEVDLRLLGTNRSLFSLTLNSNSTDFINFQINTSNKLFVRMRNKSGSLVDVAAFSVTTTAGIHKLACSYSSGDITFALDGVIIGTNTNANTDFTAALNCVLLGAGPGATTGGTQSAFSNDRIRAAALYTTRLTNDELAALTNP